MTTVVVPHIHVRLVHREGGHPEDFHYASTPSPAPDFIRSKPRSENNFTDKTYRLVHELVVGIDRYATYDEVVPVSDTELGD